MVFGAPRTKTIGRVVKAHIRLARAIAWAFVICVQEAQSFVTTLTKAQ